MGLLKGHLYSDTRCCYVGTMAFVCAFAVYGGIEVIARSGQLFIPIILIFWVISVVLLSTEFEFSNILPILKRDYAFFKREPHHLKDGLASIS
ncbi:GerAB/ArcD/ProY family transporter [Anaerobacillus sp. HL2]|nr:GerAB/ArcD/ProY family transporter [Anaerobacillus sp. HL2]